MLRSIFRRPRINILEVGAIVTILGLALPTIWINFSQGFPYRWLTTGLLLIFCAIFFAQEKVCDLHPRGNIAYMFIQTAIAAALVLLPPRIFGWLVILFYVLSAQSMFMFPFRVGMAWIGFFFAISSVVLVISDGLENALISLPIYLGGFLFFGAFSYQTVQAERSRRESERLLAELQTAHRQLQEYASKVEELAVSEERNRLAREVHDTLGHRLTVAAVQLEGAQRLIPDDPERAAGMVATVRGQVREALSELRATVATLRAPLEVDLGLASALQRLVTDFEKATGIDIHIMLPDHPVVLPETHRLALYRGAQEALTNIQRHAQATEAWLQLDAQPDLATLLVRDNGVGYPSGEEGMGFGVRGLHERAARLGGELLIEPRPGGGTQISILLPLSVQGTPVSQAEPAAGD